MNKPTLRQELIKSGLKVLNDFGYPYVTEETIITDQVYGIFFKKLLLGTKEEAHQQSVKDACDELLAEIEQGGKS